MRLLELLAEAIHLIAVFLFELKKKFHKGDIESVVSYRQPDQAVEYIPGEWMTLYNEEQPYPTLFTFSHYNCPEQYPHGLADVAAYWAEDRIFGGVLLFDRGESGQEASLNAKNHQLCPKLDTNIVHSAKTYICTPTVLIGR